MGETKHINGVRSDFSLDSSIWIFITHVNLASFLISLANYQFVKEVCKKTSVCVWRFISFLESSFCKYTLRNRIVIFLSELFFLTLSNVSLSNHGLGWKCILSHINVVLVVYFHQCFPSTSFPSPMLITFQSNYILYNYMSQKQQMRIFVLLFVYLYLWKFTYIFEHIPTYILHFTFAMYYLCSCPLSYLNWSDFPSLKFYFHF